MNRSFLEKLRISNKNKPVCTGLRWLGSEDGPQFEPISPVDGQPVATVGKATRDDFETMMNAAQAAFLRWRQVPAPRRGRAVRKMGEKFRENQHALGDLVSYEMGKSVKEGRGEVQTMIDVCEFAHGLSRQLYGLAMQSERPLHRMYEQWHPLGVIGIISAFNFPVAVWAWNAMIAAVCGDVTIWKPSEKTPLSAIACFNLLKEVLIEEDIPEGVINLIIGETSEVGEPLLADPRVELVSATGSTRMGKRVAQVVGQRLGRTLLELSGNNAVILTEHADLKIAIPSIVFGAVGTASQRCTATRRLIVHESIYDQVKAALINAYKALKIGNPLDEANQVGPLIDRQAVATMRAALENARSQGAQIIFGGEVLEGQEFVSGCYIRPALVEARNEMKIVQEETFAPILYLIRYSGEIDAGIALQNGVPQGLSSAMFSRLSRETEIFLSSVGSDCGIANVNIGTSGAEIGGAFGGDKQTGGGRELGSDCWKTYMRRQTCTVNYGQEPPTLAQGITFGQA